MLSYSVNSDDYKTVPLMPISLPMVEIKLTASNDVQVIFNTIEANQPLKMLFEPDMNITGSDAIKIMFLIDVCKSGQILFKSDSLAYVRKHNLERHFKLLAA